MDYINNRQPTVRTRREMRSMENTFNRLRIEVAKTMNCVKRRKENNDVCVRENAQNEKHLQKCPMIETK